MDLALLTRLHSAHVAELDRRYAPLLAAAGFDAVVIHSGSLRKRTEFDNQFWPLRPTPHFQHWVALAEVDCALVIRPGRKPRLLWLRSQSFWEKSAAPETEHFRENLEVVSIHAVEDVKQHLPSGGRVAFVGEDRSRGTLWGLPDSALNPSPLVDKLDQLRTRKTEYEVLCLAEANRRAALGHEVVRKMFQSGEHSELELHLAYLAATQQDNPETPYKNIVALDENGATLHHVSYLKQRRPQRSLLLDAGATYQGYCSDITRTWVRPGGAVEDAFAGLVEAVERMQQRLCSAVRVGLPYEALHDESHRQVSGILRDTGLVKLSVEEIDREGISRVFYPHGLGHSLGLQCHDVGCALVKPREANPFLRNTTTIVEGQVFTIEPGIYFIDGLLGPLRTGPHAAAIDWKLVDQLAALGGVRIEDDVVVGAEAIARNLTREQLPIGGGRVA